MFSVPGLLSTALGALHLLIGLLSLAVPVWTAINVFGLAPARTVPIATRVGGARDAVLGGWLLLSSSPGEQKRLLTALALVDILDTISAIVCFAEGNLPAEIVRAATLTSGSLAALALVAWRLRCA